MTEKDDDKLISLAAKREATERDFAQERAECIKEVLELGLSKKEATACADEVLLCDWLAFRAAVILDHLEDGQHSAEAVTKLVEIMRRGIDDRTQSET